jgi:hypothetical protein
LLRSFYEETALPFFPDNPSGLGGGERTLLPVAPFAQAEELYQRRRLHPGAAFKAA